MALSIAAAGFFVAGTAITFLITLRVSSEIKLKSALQVTNDRFLEEKKRAEEATRVKTVFFSCLSHDIRTPVTAVMGLVDLLLADSNLPEDQHTSIVQIKQSTSTLLQLLNDILDLDKLGQEKMQLEHAPFGLHDAICQVADMCAVKRPEKEFQLVVDLDDTLPRLVVGDSTRVKQVFANLLSNALKFTSEGYVVIRGRCEPVAAVTRTSMDGNRTSMDGNRSENSGEQHVIDVKFDTRGGGEGVIARRGSATSPLKQQCVFDIEDSGVGIPPDKWESVFETFVQVLQMATM
eukprot:jgi/Chlat1/3038/Chrsp208S03296